MGKNIFSNIFHSGVRTDEIFHVNFTPPPPRESSELRLEDIQAQIVLEKDPVLRAELLKTYHEVLDEAKAGKGEKKG